METRVESRLKRVGHQIGLLLVGMATKLGTLIQTQLTDNLERHEIALQDTDFGV